LNEPRDLARQLASLALEKKAENISILDLRSLSSLADCFVICSAPTDVQVKAIANHLRDEISATQKPWNVEGTEYNSWVLIDFVDVIVHVFQTEIRDFYNLEGLWADAKIEMISAGEE